MPVQLVSRSMADPEVDLIDRVAATAEASSRSRVIYDVDEAEDDDRMALGRGVVIAILLSAPAWVLLGAIVWLVKL